MNLRLNKQTKREGKREREKGTGVVCFCVVFFPSVFGPIDHVHAVEPFVQEGSGTVAMVDWIGGIFVFLSFV